jgi:hypothetical protein
MSSLSSEGGNREMIVDTVSRDLPGPWSLRRLLQSRRRAMRNLFLAFLISVPTMPSWGQSAYADPQAVRRYSSQLADKQQPEGVRVAALKHLRILLVIYGAYNFEPALPVLKSVQSERSFLGQLAGHLYNDLRGAFKRSDKRIPNQPPPIPLPVPSQPSQYVI